MFIGGSTRPSRGRPCKDQIDELRDSVLRAAIGTGMGGAELDSIAIAVLLGKRLTRSRMAHLSKTYTVLKEPCDWPLELLRVSDFKRIDLERLIAPYFAESSSIRKLSVIELSEAADADVLHRQGHQGNQLASIGSIESVGYIFPLSEEEISVYPARAMDALVKRGDMYGFLGCLMTYRIAHGAGDFDLQWIAGRALIRSLPGACLHPFIRPIAGTLIDLTCSVLSLMPKAAFPIHVDRDITLSLVRSGKPYSEGSTDDPLITYQLVPCKPRQATLVLGSG